MGTERRRRRRHGFGAKDKIGRKLNKQVTGMYACIHRESTPHSFSQLCLGLLRTGTLSLGTMHINTYITTMVRYGYRWHRLWPSGNKHRGGQAREPAGFEKCCPNKTKPGQDLCTHADALLPLADYMPFIPQMCFPLILPL